MTAVSHAMADSIAASGSRAETGRTALCAEHLQRPSRGLAVIRDLPLCPDAWPAKDRHVQHGVGANIHHRSAHRTFEYRRVALRDTRRNDDDAEFERRTPGVQDEYRLWPRSCRHWKDHPSPSATRLYRQGLRE